MRRGKIELAGRYPSAQTAVKVLKMAGYHIADGAPREWIHPDGSALVVEDVSVDWPHPVRIGRPPE